MSKQVTKLGQVSKASKRKSTAAPKKRPAATVVEDEDIDVQSVTMAISSIAEEGQETKDLMEMERNYSTEVITQLKEIIKPLNATFQITLGSVSKNYPSVSTGVLTSEGLVCLLDAKGAVLARRPLEEFPIETILYIVSDILPDVNNHVAHFQERPTERLSAIERITKELKKIIVGDEALK